MNLPEWMLKQFESGTCSHCNKKLNPAGVRGHGIFEEKSPTKKKVRHMHYYQYICPKCKLETRFKFPTDWEEFIQSVAEVAESEWDEEHPVREIEGISDEEVESVKKMLDSTEFYEDFLSSIGVQIDEYLDDENK